MKNTFMLMAGAALGVGAMMGISKVSSNKYKIKKTMDDIIDDTADMFK